VPNQKEINQMTISKQVTLWEATAECHRDAMRADLTTADGSVQEELARAADGVAESLRQYAIALPAGAAAVPVVPSLIDALAPFASMPDDPERDADKMTGMRISFGELRKIKTALAGQAMPAPATRTVWTLTTDGDNCALTTSVHPTKDDAAESVRDTLRGDCKPSQLASLEAMTAEELSEAWGEINDGACIIESHEMPA
jgi:hypothetical protein